jgi:toxin ParE1/3/4
LRVELAERARQDLRDIFSYLVAENPPAAKRVLSRVEGALEKLRRFPELGRPGALFDDRTLSVARTKYVIHYRIDGSLAYVTRILHGTQQWPRMPWTDEDK